MIIFWGQVTDLTPFKADFEATERRLMTAEQFQKEYGGGNPDLLRVVLEAALVYHIATGVTPYRGVTMTAL